MHLYSLDSRAFPESQCLDKIKLAMSFKDQVLLIGQVANENEMVLRRINMRDGSQLSLRVKFNIGKLDQIKILQEKLIVFSQQKFLGWIEIQRILKTSKYGLSFVEESHFQYNINIKNAKSKAFFFDVKFVGPKMIAVFLADNAISFQEMSYNQGHNLKLTIKDLQFKQSSKISFFKMFSIPKNKKNIQKQQICIFLIIQTENGHLDYAIVDMLWNTKQFSVKQLLYKSNRTHPQGMETPVELIDPKHLVFSQKEELVICEKSLRGWLLLCIIKIQYTVQDIFRIKSEEHSFLIISKTKDERVVLKYNLYSLLQYLEIDPMVIGQSQPINGPLLGYFQINQSKNGLLVSHRLYLLAPAILDLTQLLITSTTTFESYNQLGRENFWMDLLPYEQFLSYIQNEDRRKNKMKQLFSAQRLIQLVSQFQKVLEKFVFYIEKRKIIILEALLRQYVLIWVYLCSFLKFIENQGSEQEYNKGITNSNLIQQFLAASSGLNMQAKWIENPKVEEAIGKNLNILRSNILAILTLHSKFKQELTSLIQINEIIHFITDRTYAVNYLVFMLLYCYKKQHCSQYYKFQQMLRQVVALRNDYPPLIGLLCNNNKQYTLNKFHLKHCRQLTQEENKISEGDLGQLSSFKNVNCSATQYLKKIKLRHLDAFVHTALKDEKYNDDLLILTIPEHLKKQVKRNWKPNLVQIQSDTFLLLSEKMVLQMFRNFQEGGLEHIYVMTEDSLHSMYDSLVIIGQTFIQELRQQYYDRLKIRQYNLQLKWKCKILSNKDYQDLKQQKGQTMTKQGILKQYHLYQGSQAQKKYFRQIRQIGDEYGIELINHLLRKNEQKASTMQTEQHIFDVDCSGIQISKPIPAHNSLQKQQKLMLMLLRHMWSVYDSLVAIGEDEFEVQEELYATEFGQTFVKLITCLSNCVNNKKSFPDSKNTLAFQNIIKAYSEGHKIKITSTFERDFFVAYQLPVLKSFLINHLFQSDRKWIASMDDLLMEALLQNVSLSQQLVDTIRKYFDFKTIKRRR